jgi:hypothetical protein
MYVVASLVWLVAPIAERFNSVLLGTAVFRHDSFLNAAVLEWGYHAIPSSHERVFEWTAGFPLANTLAATENLVGWQLLYTPLRFLGAGVPAAYNVVMLASLVISGVGALLLARRLGAARLGAFAAGFIFAFGPFHLDHLLHLQTMGVCWSPFAILFLDRYLDGRRPGDAIGLAAFFVLTALSSIYFAVFLALVLPLYAALCWMSRRYRFDLHALLGLLATGAVTAAVLMPLISHYLRFNRAVGYHHSAKTIADFSMELAAPLRVPDWQVIWAWTPLVRVMNWASPLSYTPAFPGIIALALAIYAMVRLRRDPSARGSVWILVTLAVISYLLALGPILKPVNLNPLQSLSWVPMPGKIWLIIPGIRWPMRIFFFAWLAGAILCGLGISALERRVPLERKRIVVFGLLALIAIEYWPKSWLAGRSAVAVDPMQLSDAYPFLAREADRGGVVEVPTSDASGWRTPFSTRYIYGSSGHLRRIVALHGNVMPPVTDSLLRAADALPDSAAARILATHGVTRVVVHVPLMGDAKSATVIAAMKGAGYSTLFTGHEGVVFSTIGVGKEE